MGSSVLDGDKNLRNQEQIAHHGVTAGREQLITRTSSE